MGRLMITELGFGHRSLRRGGACANLNPKHAIGYDGF